MRTPHQAVTEVVWRDTPLHTQHHITTSSCQGPHPDRAHHTPQQPHPSLSVHHTTPFTVTPPHQPHPSLSLHHTTLFTVTPPHHTLHCHSTTPATSFTVTPPHHTLHCHSTTPHSSLSPPHTSHTRTSTQTGYTTAVSSTATLNT